MGEPDIAGICDERFSRVRDAFVNNFVTHGEVGAAVCVTWNHEIIVDLVGGWCDENQTRAWGPDTLVDVFSVGKPFIAVLLLKIIDAGLLNLDDHVVDVWPPYGAHGKEATTIRQAMSHMAGVPALSMPMTNDDLWNFETMTDALAATVPWAPPGTHLVYHSNTYSHLIGGIINAVSQELPGTALARLAAELDLDVHVGLDDAQIARCADVVGVLTKQPQPVRYAVPAADDMVAQSYFNPPGYCSMGVVNSDQWRRAQVPSTNTHATARAISRFYGALLEPGRILSPELLQEATRIQSTGYCPVLEEETSFGLGFKPTSPRRPFGPNPGAFGHFGTGGALGFCDPATGIGFGYVMNHVIPRWQSPRNRSLIDALYTSISQLSRT